MVYEERRSRDRCPVCQGPTKDSKTNDSGIECRNTLCSFNYQEVKCPRCGKKMIDPIDHKNGKVHCSCKNCQASFEL